MRSPLTNSCVPWLVVAAVLWASPVPADDNITPDQLTFFESKIRPVLVRECYGCHSNQAGQARGGLRLDTRELTLIGGDSGPSVVPGDPDESPLISAIEHEDFIMPPGGKSLTREQIQDFRQWVEMGAPDPRRSEAVEVHSSITPEMVADARDSFWSLQPVVAPEVPVDPASTWSDTAIDRFIERELKQSDLRPANDAPARAALRRLTYDLIGLPPTIEQQEWFYDRYQSDPGRAIADAASSLLEQSEFGERWGRHWLDVARYAESTGREVNMTYPHAWRYRDFVIDSYNEDKPIDEFIRQQLAGDLLPAASDEDWAENLIATSFLAIGSKNLNEQNGRQFVADLVDEQIDAVTRVFLGTSVACARCHDHKFDPISQADYYALAGIFGSTKTYFGNPPSKYGQFSPVQARRTGSLIRLPIEDPNPFDPSYSTSELAKLEQEMQDALREAAEARRGGSNAAANRIRTANQLAQISAKLAVVDDSGQPLSYCMGVQENEVIRDAAILVRGEIDLPADSVRRGIPELFAEHAISIPSGQSGRRELAEWIASNENPLTPRVYVNRVWSHLMGHGLVSTPDDFGSTGKAPSHPELLDYLTDGFVRSGWSTKTLVKAIVTSRVYRMDTTFDERSHAYDPDNARYWRAEPRRLEAEAMRDGMLHVAGVLDRARPRGSLVAETGYARVRGGQIGDPREAIRKATENAIAEERERARQQGYEAFRGNRFRQPPTRRGPSSAPGAGMSRFTSRMAGASDRIRERIAEAATASPTDVPDANYRSVYMPMIRNQLPRALEVFDLADPDRIVGDREASDTPNQALFMMNNPMVLRAADAMADRLSSEYRASEQIAGAFRLTLARTPSSSERSAASHLLASLRRDGMDLKQSLAVLCQGLFASTEFRYLD